MSNKISSNARRQFCHAGQDFVTQKAPTDFDLQMDSFTSKLINGGLETSPNYRVTVDAHELQQQVCAMAGFGVYLYISFQIAFGHG